MDASTIIAMIRQEFELLRPVMTERMRRHWAASEALSLPRGGTTLVAEATRMSRTTIWAGARAPESLGLPFTSERSPSVSAARRWTASGRSG